MTLVLRSSSSFAMPCGFHGDSVDFDSVAVESEFCAGDWALPSPVCAPNNSNNNNQHNEHLHSLDIVGEAAFNFAAADQRRSNAVDAEDSSLVTDELKSRLMGRYDDCVKMDTDDEFDVCKNGKGDRKQDDEDEELFFQPPRRISMLWNSKLRWKEERKKVLKMSIDKLKRIEDPELFLCRSVLINNTVRRLHREIRDEKMARYPQVHRPVPVNSCSLVAACHTANGGIPEAFPCRKRPSSPSFSSSSSSSFSSLSSSSSGCREGSGTTCPAASALLPSCCTHRESSLSSTSSSISSSSSCTRCRENSGLACSSTSLLPCCCNNKENLQDDGQSEEENDGVPPCAKRIRTLCVIGGADGTDGGSGIFPNNQGLAEGAAPCRELASNRATCSLASSFLPSDKMKARCDQSARSPPGGEYCPSREDKLWEQAKDRGRGLLVSEYEKQYSQYSCGQLSIFGELQSVVFHSLIASLES